jgi:hypothetical protein
MAVINVIVGALLLVLGRKIFWFFVAAVGFYAGYELASRYFNLQPAWMALAIGLAVGLAGALLAIFFEKLVIGASGFLAGVFIASRLIPLAGAQLQLKNWDWVIILIGGIIGIVLVYAIFEWALVILSAGAGAILIVEALKLASLVALVVGVVLFIIGVAAQTGLNRRAQSRKRATE